MPTIEDPNTRERLHELVDAGESAVNAFLSLLSQDEALLAFSHLDEEDQSRALALMDPSFATDLIERLPDTGAAKLIARLDPSRASLILQKLASDERVDILSLLDDDEAERILSEMAPHLAAEARAMRAYPDDSAGGLMSSEFLVYPHNATVAQVLDDMRLNAGTYADYDVQYTYVADDDWRLVGVLRMRDLLLTLADRPISELMIRDPVAVLDTDTLGDLKSLFDARQFFGVPVVNARGRIIGVVKRSALQRALAERTGSDYSKSQGIVGDELRSMPTMVRARRRFEWLATNILLSVIAASVIALYEETIAAVIALAVFLPIISDMSGNAGGQAVAVTMRELALGLTTVRDIKRVLVKEIGVALLNGAALGVILGLIAWAWQGVPVLGLVVGVAMALGAVVGACLGGVTPLLLKRLRIDPALATGPLLTTVTNVCGFFFVLSLANAAMPWLQS